MPSWLLPDGSELSVGGNLHRSAIRPFLQSLSTYKNGKYQKQVLEIMQKAEDQSPETIGVKYLGWIMLATREDDNLIALEGYPFQNRLLKNLFGRNTPYKIERISDMEMIDEQNLFLFGDDYLDILGNRTSYLKRLPLDRKQIRLDAIRQINAVPKESSLCEETTTFPKEDTSLQDLKTEIEIQSTFTPFNEKILNLLLELYTYMYENEDIFPNLITPKEFKHILYRDEMFAQLGDSPQHRMDSIFDGLTRKNFKYRSELVNYMNQIRKIPYQYNCFLENENLLDEK